MRKRTNGFLKDKSFMIVLGVCVLSITAVVAASVAINNRGGADKNDLDLNEPIYNAESEATTSSTQPSTEPETTTRLSAKASKKNEPTSTYSQEETTTDAIAAAEVPTTREVSAMTVGQQPSTPPVNAVNATASNLNFNVGSILNWPVYGNILLDFSMDTTIYFPTLDSYKCNPAIIIQSDINKEVLSAAQGVVKEINVDEEIGSSVVVSLGNGYELTYGQLKSIEVAVGDEILPNQVIACINEPTKYYSVEGYNLYLKLTKDGVPVDPLDFLKYAE